MVGFFGVTALGAGDSTVFEQLAKQREVKQIAPTTPRVATCYKSAEVLNKDKVKHTRRPTAPDDEYRVPLTSSQVVGWRCQDAKPLPAGTSYHHRSTELSNFNDANTKHVHGRSVVAERSVYGEQRTNTQLTPTPTTYTVGSKDDTVSDVSKLVRDTGNMQPNWPRRAEIPNGTQVRSGTRYGETFLATCSRGPDRMAPMTTTLGNTASSLTGKHESLSQGYKPV
ncbi:hypothetical protein RI054_04g20250 [Pseudoscourfieldia marina]